MNISKRDEALLEAAEAKEQAAWARTMDAYRSLGARTEWEDALTAWDEARMQLAECIKQIAEGEQEKD